MPTNTAVSVMEQMKSGSYQQQSQQAPSQGSSSDYYWPF